MPRSAQLCTSSFVVANQLRQHVSVSCDMCSAWLQVGSPPSRINWTPPGTAQHKGSAFAGHKQALSRVSWHHACHTKHKVRMSLLDHTPAQNNEQHDASHSSTMPHATHNTEPTTQCPSNFTHNSHSTVSTTPTPLLT